MISSLDARIATHRNGKLVTKIPFIWIEEIRHHSTCITPSRNSSKSFKKKVGLKWKNWGEVIEFPGFAKNLHIWKGVTWVPFCPSKQWDENERSRIGDLIKRKWNAELYDQLHMSAVRSSDEREVLVLFNEVQFDTHCVLIKHWVRELRKRWLRQCGQSWPVDVAAWDIRTFN